MFGNLNAKLTINAPVFYTERAKVSLMREERIRGGLEGVGIENRDFFWAKWHKQSEGHLAQKKSWFSVPTPSNPPRFLSARIKLPEARSI